MRSLHAPPLAAYTAVVALKARDRSGRASCRSSSTGGCERQRTRENASTPDEEASAPETKQASTSEQEESALEKKSKHA